MSYLEFIGTVFNLACVWLVSINLWINWPIGIIGSTLFLILFYQIRLYSDFIEQIYYIITGFIGWYLWFNPTKNRKKEELKISNSSKESNLIYLLAISLGSLFLTILIVKIHIILPNFFPEEASFPFMDAFTTILSFCATILMTKRKIDCWYLWITVDVIGVFLYFAKGVVFVSLLYFLFLILAIRGFINWKKILFSYAEDN